MAPSSPPRSAADSRAARRPTWLAVPLLALLAMPLAPLHAAAAPVGGPRLAASGLVVERPASVPPPPAVRTLAYVVADATTGDILAAKAPHRLLPPASTLKVLTALTVLPRLRPTATCTATHGDAAIEGSKVGVVPGGRYTVEQLWQAVFLRSGNDAVSCLVALDGGSPLVLSRMATAAEFLGALDTTVRNPTGLDAPGQVSSAYDLALLGRAALRRPDLMRYAATTRSVFPGKVAAKGKPRATFELWSEQKFLLNYPDAIGIKNGYTTQAKNTLIAASRRGGRTILVTLMYAPHNAWKDAAALSDWAYRYGPRTQPVGVLVAPGYQPPGAAVDTPRTTTGAAAPLAPGGSDPSRPQAGAGPVSSAGVAALVALGGTAAVVAAVSALVLLRRRRGKAFAARGFRA